MSHNYEQEQTVMTVKSEPTIGESFPDVGIIRQVGDESFAVITRLSSTEEHPKFVGNILRRTCQLGGTACQKLCQFRGLEEHARNVEQKCADANLRDALVSLGIEPHNTIMVAVTGDNVGFADQSSTYIEQGIQTTNQDGWAELAGFNAYFSRPGVDGEPVAIGSRLADCAHFEFEFKDADGNTVIGFEHGTRPNMFGQGQYKFDVDGRKVSYTEYVLTEAIRHYGADPASFHIRLSSSIRPENFVKHFDSIEKMEGHIPGWYEAGFVRNVTNPDWKPGDAVATEDEWHADARGMILHDIAEAMKSLGISTERFVADDMLDPADSYGEYSSYENRALYGDYRDLYLTAHISAVAK